MTYTLTRTPEGKYLLRDDDNATDLVVFNTAQDAIDFWEEAMYAWPWVKSKLAINIDHRVHRGYFG